MDAPITAALSADHPDVKQFRDFLISYNELTEKCFTDCVRDFTTRKVSDKEEKCAGNCLDKYLKMTQRISLRFQEFQLTQNEAAAASAGVPGLLHAK